MNVREAHLSLPKLNPYDKIEDEIFYNNNFLF